MEFYNCFLIAVFVLPDTYDTDGYNPEAPSITNTSRPMYRHRVHAQRPNLIGLTSGDMDLPPRGTLNIFSQSLCCVIHSDNLYTAYIYHVLILWADLKIYSSLITCFLCIK